MSNPYHDPQWRRGRYMTLFREIVSVMGTRDAMRWLGAHKALAQRSLAAFEREWDREKTRRKEMR